MKQEILPPIKIRERKRHPNSGRKKLPIDYDKLENLAARGMTKGQIAICLGLGSSTFAGRFHEDPQVNERYQKGIADGIAAVTGQLLKCVKAGNMTAIMYYLNCKAGWKETKLVQHQRIADLPPADCTLEEAEEAYAASMRMIEAQK